MNDQPTATEVLSGTLFDSKPDDFIVLDETQRHRRRIVMESAGGTRFLLDLPKTELLRHGDILPLSNGQKIQVRAAPEHLLRVSGRDRRHLLALAWQIGNRHLAAQIRDDHLLIRYDRVIADMLIGLGAVVEEIETAFEPEGGAYGGEHYHHD